MKTFKYLFVRAIAYCVSRSGFVLLGGASARWCFRLRSLQCCCSPEWYCWTLPAGAELLKPNSFCCRSTRSEMLSEAPPARTAAASIALLLSLLV